MSAVTDPPNNRRKSHMIPVVQLVAAVVAFGGWAILGLVLGVEDQVLPIRSYAFSATLSLIITLGIPYLIPNLFRGVPMDARSGYGPWSRPLGFAALSVVGTVTVGTLVAAFGSPLIGSTLATGALLSAGIVALQLARLRSSLVLAAVGASGQVALPVLWLGAGMLSSEYARGIAVSSMCFVGVLLFLRAIAPFGPRIGFPRRHIGNFARRALYLLPHLVAFSIVIQGLRILTAFLGLDETVMAGHYLALGIAAGNTLLASLNSLFSVELQSAHDAEMVQLRVKMSARFALAGLMSSAGGAVAIFALKWFGIFAFPGVSGWLVVIVCASPIVLAVYYKNSAQLVREGRTGLLSIISVCTAVFAVVVPLTVRCFTVPSLNLLTLAYMASLLSLAIAATVAARRKEAVVHAFKFASTPGAIICYLLMVSIPAVALFS